MPRRLLFLFLAAAALGQLALIHREGWVPAWQRHHLDARAPHFSDLRVITGAGDSLDQGFNPREENPGAPFRQRFNQTGIWLHLRDLGIHEADSTAVGLALLAGYALGLWWLSAGIGRAGALLLAGLVVSPAALLAVERGTTDLSVFFLLALAGLLAERRALGAAGAILLAFWLKLFPLAGVAVFLRESRPRALRLGLAVLGVAALYCAWNFRDLVDIGFKTEKGPHTSYGWNVLALHLGRHSPWTPVARFGGLAFALGSIAVAVALARRRAAPPAGERGLDFFRLGAAVYAGTFLLGASWDYRLIFTAFLVPQLVRWTGSADASLRRWARAALAALVVAAWSLALKDWIGGSAAGRIAVRTVEEAAKASLYFICLTLLAWTRPVWLPPSRPPAPPANFP